MSRLNKDSQQTAAHVANSDDAPIVQAYAVNVVQADGVRLADGSLLPPPPPPIPPHLNSFSRQPQSFRTVPANLNEGAIREYLSQHDWPLGLQTVLVNSLKKIPIRYFICDDSGSMMENDGHRLVGRGQQTSVVSCSRWAELTETLKFHVGLARHCQMPTEFRLLNSAQPITIGANPQSDQVGEATLMAVFQDSPGGMTPLCRHIKEIIAQITAIAPQLLANGQKVALIIATDGESSDGDIAAAMAPLCDLPVWVVVRLCTDDQRIVNYWNDIDSRLELEMDVLDDFIGEAEEVQKVNSWLTYGEPMHRLREFGVSLKEFDMLDEAKLTADQMKGVVATIFDMKLSELPHPEAQWREFLQLVNEHNEREHMVWNAKTKSPQRWIVIKKLQSLYGKGAGCVIN